MSFFEKSTWLQLMAIALVYGGYFALIAMAAGEVPLDQINYQGMMLITVVLLVVVLIVGYVCMFVIAPDTQDLSDERDRAIERKGEQFGGAVLGVGALVALGLSMMEFPHFWISNAILLGLVLAEVLTGLVKVFLYRRGISHW